MSDPTPHVLLCNHPAPLVQPQYTEWALGHPLDRGCVTMMLGKGVEHQGAWWDVDCVGDINMFSVCERDKMSVLSHYIVICVLLSSSLSSSLLSSLLVII